MSHESLEERLEKCIERYQIQLVRDKEGRVSLRQGEKTITFRPEDYRGTTLMDLLDDLFVTISRVDEAPAGEDVLYTFLTYVNELIDLGYEVFYDDPHFRGLSVHERAHACLTRAVAEFRDAQRLLAEVLETIPETYREWSLPFNGKDE
jgi:hypothetical protein